MDDSPNVSGGDVSVRSATGVVLVFCLTRRRVGPTTHRAVICIIRTSSPPEPLLTTTPCALPGAQAGRLRTSRGRQVPDDEHHRRLQSGALAAPATRTPKVRRSYTKSTSANHVPDCHVHEL